MISSKIASWESITKRLLLQSKGSNLDNKNIIVTGGTGSLGRAVVSKITELGGRCFVPSRREINAEELGFGSSVKITSGVDLTDEKAVERFYISVPNIWASVHVAGGFSMSPLFNTSLADFQKMMAMNAETAFVCSRFAAIQMSKTGNGGRIVNVASRPALSPRDGTNLVSYTASKSAVVAMTISLAEELKKHHILVNAVAPSTMDTPANRRDMPDAKFSKWLKTEDAAAAICQLISPNNREISGAVLPLYARA